MFSSYDAVASQMSVDFDDLHLAPAAPGPPEPESPAAPTPRAATEQRDALFMPDPGRLWETMRHVLACVLHAAACLR